MGSGVFQDSSDEMGRRLGLARSKARTVSPLPLPLAWPRAAALGLLMDEEISPAAPQPWPWRHAP